MTTEEAIRRCRQIEPMLRDNVVTAVVSHSVMEAFNETIPKGMEGIHSEFTDTYNAVQNALALKLAMDLARIFDLSADERFPPEKQDKASVQVLAALLTPSDVQEAFSRAAEAWSPVSEHVGTIGPHEEEAVREALDVVEEERRSTDRSDCLRAIDELLAISRQLGLEGSDEKAALKRIRDFRTLRLAHSLFDREPEESPYFNDLTFLLELAKTAAGCAALAIEGHNIDFDERASRQRKNAEGYAACVLDGLRRASQAG